MALPTLDATFASSADLPRRQMLAKWLVNLQYSGSIEDYYTLPEKYLYAKIAVAAGASRSEADYISLPDRYVWSDIYKAVSGSSGQTIDRGEKEAIGWIAAAVRGDAGDPAKVATYINWPWRYQVASIITALAVDSDAQSFVTTSGATNVEAIDQFVKGVKNLGLWDSMVCWPLRSTQNAGTGTTAYSLGGLGTYNGTLVNGPTWGTDGTAFDGTDDYFTANWLGISTEITALAVHKVTSVSSSNRVIQFRAGLTVGGLWSPFTDGNAYWDSINQDTARTFGLLGATANTFFSHIGIGSPNNIEQYRNGTVSISTLATPASFNYTPLVMELGRNSTVTAYQGTIAFVLLAQTSSVSASVLHNLYKSTLGTGLGLP